MDAFKIKVGLSYEVKFPEYSVKQGTRCFAVLETLAYRAVSQLKDTLTNSGFAPNWKDIKPVKLHAHRTPVIAEIGPALDEGSQLGYNAVQDLQFVVEMMGRLDLDALLEEFTNNRKTAESSGAEQFILDELNAAIEVVDHAIRERDKPDDEEGDGQLELLALPPKKASRPRKKRTAPAKKSTGVAV